MKKILYLVLAFSIASCGMSKEEKLISEYEQTLDNTKIDLKFDPLETRKLKTITGLDSAEIIKGWYDSLAGEEQDLLSNIFDRDIAEADKYADKLSYATGPLRTFVLETHQNYIDEADSLLTLIKEIDKDPVVGVPEFYKEKVRTYEAKGTVPLVEYWECRYRIFNPILQVDQEITKRYAIDLEKTKIIQTF